MTNIDFLCLTPLIVTAAAPILIMVMVTISRNFRAVYLFTLSALVISFLSLLAVAPHAPHSIHPLLIIDSFSILFLGIIYISSILVTVFSYDYLSRHSGERDEYFIILFVAILGASFLVIAEHFVTFFLGLETLSISLYILISYLKYRAKSVEAGIKFLVIASLATSFLLFGMGLIYSETGSMYFRDIITLAGTSKILSPIFLAGFALMLTGIGFKLALVPFHMWTPDIYNGAPVPVAAFIATVSKSAVMALAIRLFVDIRGFENRTVFLIISAISILSMFTGNLLALKQTNLKRLLAYSSIAHLGYLLITLLTGTQTGIEAAIFYLVAYTITTLGAFGVISGLSVCEQDADSVKDLRGLFWSNPVIAFVLSLSFFSLAGLPLTAGFISKFYLVLAGVKSDLWLLAFSLIINSVISLYYYLRVVKEMFVQTEIPNNKQAGVVVRLILLIIAAAILLLGILPSFLTEFISKYSSIN